MKKYCEFCGEPLSKSDIFCKGCGAAINNDEVIKDAIIENDKSNKSNTTFITTIIVIILIIIVIGLLFYIFK